LLYSGGPAKPATTSKSRPVKRQEFRCYAGPPAEARCFLPPVA
jgi:hypothetical protein